MLAAQDTKIILYIEDDPASKKILQSLVDDFDDITLVTAWSAEEGIKLAGKLSPQLIFLDINLPCMCGHEAIQHLITIPELAHTQFVALIESATPLQIETSLRLGFNDYIAKPSDISKPINVIKVKDIIQKMFFCNIC